MSQAGIISVAGSSGGTPIVKVTPQAHTAPGTSPVLADGAGNINLNGSIVAAHSIPIQTDSLAANTINVEVQYAAAVAATDGTKVGMAAFNSAQFTVDASGFVSSVSSSFTWSVITADQTAVVNNGYICNKGSALLLALPATSAVGDTIKVTGINTALGWKITQAAGQQIFFGTQSTTLGATGFLQSAAIRDAIEIVCIAANTTWQELNCQGNITVN